MKKLLLNLLLFASIFAIAQVPQGISYQAIALDDSNAPIVNGNVGLQLSILDASASGTVLYSETHSVTTNMQGLFDLTIGQGNATSGTFNTIDWGADSRFLQVEMDANGGTNYVLVGTTQLLSVPYALAADSLVTSPGEGITLVAPNGTPYQLTVDNNGNLSLPTSSQSSNVPTQLFMYGTFNGFDASTALQFGNSFQDFVGFKYLTAGTEIRFLAAQNENVVYGGNGNNQNGTLTLNGQPITIQANGFYRILMQNTGTDLFYQIDSINVELETNFGSPETMSLDTNTETFFRVSNTYGEIRFVLDRNNFTVRYGDNLADGVIEQDGAPIQIPFIVGEPDRLYELVINFNGTGSYVISSI